MVRCRRRGGLFPGFYLALSAAGMLLALSAHAEEKGQLEARLYWERSVARADREELLWLYVQDSSGTRPDLTVTLTVDLFDKSTRGVPAAAWEGQSVYIGGHRAHVLALQHRQGRTFQSQATFSDELILLGIEAHPNSLIAHFQFPGAARSFEPTRLCLLGHNHFIAGAARNMNSGPTTFGKTRDQAWKRP